MNPNDALPTTAHDTADDRPLDMIDTATLRDYMRQLRARYSLARSQGRNAYASELAITFHAIRTEFRKRNS
jgi:hypothetical protein